MLRSYYKDVEKTVDKAFSLGATWTLSSCWADWTQIFGDFSQRTEGHQIVITGTNLALMGLTFKQLITFGNLQDLASRGMNSIDKELPTHT